MLYDVDAHKKGSYFRHIFFGLPEVAGGVVRHRKIESIYERLKQHLRDGNSGTRMGTYLVGWQFTVFRKRVIQGGGHMNRGYKPLAK